MKKAKFLLCMLLILSVFLPICAYAEDVEILFNDFIDWTGTIPYGWEFDSVNGSVEPGDSCAEIDLADYGYALLDTVITLEPSAAYRITVPVDYTNVSEDGVGVNVNIADQYAQSGYLYGSGSDTLSLYVVTNADETQDYRLRIGLGNEESYSLGSLSIHSLSISRIEEVPDDVYAYSLIGSVGIYGDSYDTSAEDEDNSGASVADYNTTGIVITGLLFTLLFYLFFTGKWANRFSARMSNFYALLIMFLVAFLLRVYLSAHSEGHITDLNCFKAWAVHLRTYGLSGFYESSIFADYMPGYYYILYVIGGIYQQLGLGYDSAAYQFLIELVPILCDLALAFVAYRIISRKNPRYGTLAALFLLYAPFVFTDSVVWGQIDSVFTLALVGVVYLFYRRRKLPACLVWAVALMIKPQALLLAPVIAIVFLADLVTPGKTLRTLIEALLSILGIAAAVLLISLPMKGGQPLTYVLNLMLNTTGQYAYATVNCFNLYGIFGANFVADTESFLFGISYANVGWVLILLSTVFVAVLYLKKRDPSWIFTFSGLYLMLICLLAHNMHERYLFPAVVFLVIAAFMQDDRRLLFSAVSLGALLYANMEIVLAFRQELIYPWVTRLFSILFLAAGAYTVYAVCRSLFRKEKCAIFADVSPVPSLACVRAAAANRQLNSAPHVNRRMTKKDWLILLIITAVYGVIALTNLGSTTIPQAGDIWEEDASDPIVITLEESTYIDQFKYYTGYCEGNFRVYTSLDGFDYEEIPQGEIFHEYANMFRWYSYPVETTAKYIKLEKTSGYLELREIGFFNADNTLIATENAVLISGSSRQDASYLIDEQEQVPIATSYMTEMYFDEVYHARTAYEYLNGIEPYEITHPPLGKAFIALGILLFGMNPFGWRFAGAVAGILMLPILYIFAKRVFRKSKWAAVSTLLFAADFMHYSLTRIATIDSFTLLFILLMYVCMYEYTLHNFFTEKLSRTLLPLGLCGLFFGLGAATKWISLYAGLGLAIIFFYTVFQRIQEYRLLKAQEDPRAADFSRKLILTLLFCVGVFIILPAAIYCLSYLPYEWASDGTFGIQGILENQSYMFNYHGYLTTDNPHPYSSQWQTWPYSIRPVFFFLATGPDAAKTAVIWCMGNPLLWWSGVLAFLFIAGKRHPEKPFETRGLVFLLVAAFCQLAPNLLITREMFLYHYFTIVPFMCMGIVYVLRYLEENYRHGKKFTVVFLVLICLMFALFYPVITGTPISYDHGKALQWLDTWPI